MSFKAATAVQAIALCTLAYHAYLQRDRVKQLTKCPTYKVLTRQGLDLYWQQTRRKSNLAVVFLDLDFMHELNAKLGYQAVDAKIAKAMQTRKGETIARWYSGDELVCIVPAADAAQCADRLRRSLQSQGLSATFGIAPVDPTEPLANAVNVAAGLVQSAKAQNRRGEIHQP